MLEQAAQIDDQHAGLQYDLAKSYDTLSRFSAARDAYQRANDRDLCPLRITSPLREALGQVARETGTTMIPVRELFERRSRHEIPGSFLLVDHVHPSISGHQMIAQQILQQMIADGLVHPQPGWEQHREQSYRQHLDDLDDKYFLQGQRRLEGLRNWSQGRAKLAPGSSPDGWGPVED